MSPALTRKISNISQKIKEEYSGVEIFLFGSTSKGTDTEDSDIDLCFIFEKPDERLRSLSRKLRKEIYPALKKPLDILVYDKETFEDRATLPMTMESTIKTEGKRL